MAWYRTAGPPADVWPERTRTRRANIRAEFLEKLRTGDLDAFTLPSDRPGLRGYIELALRGGYPEPALRLSGDARESWLGGYLEQLLTRDAQGIAGHRDPLRLRRYFEATALSTAGQPEHKTLYDAAAINRKTAIAYDALLTNLFVLELVPAWASNRLTRLIKAPKRYLVDPSLAGAALGLDPGAVLRDGNLPGRVIDSFAVAQIRPELQLGLTPAASLPPTRQAGPSRDRFDR